MLIADDLLSLFEIFPESIKSVLTQQSEKSGIIEIVLDLGCKPEVRFLNSTQSISQPVTWYDLEYCVRHTKPFGKDNRAGIEKTLHRISCIRNRQHNIVGLTCRIGRALFGTIDFLRDLVEREQSILFLGKPGVGKTTIIREIARILSDEMSKRVVIIDTSNEIAGDGDIPHPSIGKARRMQVLDPALQHQVMIEAVENHMPQVIIIDEIGTELEAFAARTIAERGVQLIATAHGNSVANLIKNPTLVDLVGGVQYVTLSDEVAKKRGSQKSIVERKEPSTFETAVEIYDRRTFGIHFDVEKTVDRILKNQMPFFQIRKNLVSSSRIVSCKSENLGSSTDFDLESQLLPRIKKVNLKKLSFLKQKTFFASYFSNTNNTQKFAHSRILFLYSNIKISYKSLQYLIQILNLPIVLTRRIEQAHVILADTPANTKTKKFASKLLSFNVRMIYYIPNNNLTLVSKVLRQMVNLKRLAT
jgi:stage III sporulation protein AA